MDGHGFESVLRKAWSILPCKSLSRLILQLIFMYNLKALRIWIWPSSCFACPLRNLPANPFPRIPADWSPGRVAFNAALAVCGKGWRQGLHILKTMRRPIPRARLWLWNTLRCSVGAVARVWQSLLMCWRAPKQFGWMHVLLHYIWDWLHINMRF